MKEILKELLELQGVDTRLNAVRARLATFPKRLAELHARIEASRAALDKSKESHSTALKDRKRYELDVEQWKEKVRKYKDQSFQVKTNEAYKALQHEVEMAETEIAKAEDRLLEQMVSGEQYDGQVKSAEKSLSRSRSKSAAARAEIEAEKAVAEKELAQLEAERAKVVKAIPEDLLDHYQRIAKKHGGRRRGGSPGRSLRRLRRANPASRVSDLRREDTGELYHCELCTRILYYIEPP